MPRQCQVCVSPVRLAFEAAVGAGQTVKAAARGAGLPYDACKRHIRAHGRAAPAPTLQAVASSPVDTFERAMGHEPMTWQRGLLAEARDTLLLKARQVGATEVAAALAIHVAQAMPGSTSCIISPSLRQSTEVTLRARLGFWAMGETLRQDSTTVLATASGSRVVSLPGTARGVRGYAADLVVIDEASWVTDDAYSAARPLTAASGGRMIVQSTPGAPVGWFYELTENVPDDWAFMKVRADEVPTISAEFLERQRRELSTDLYRQEYMAEFGSGGIDGSLFNLDQLAGLVLQETA